MRPILAIPFGILLLASCRHEKSAYHPICAIPIGGDPHAVELLAKEHGLRTMHGGGSFGSGDLIVEGTLDDAYLARECLRSHEHARAVHINSWPADVVSLPGDPSWPEFRVASVELSASRRAVADLQAEGIAPRLYFGSKTDFVYVPRADALKAWAVFRSNPRPGLIPFHPDFERLPPPYDALSPLTPDDSDHARAMEFIRRFPEPAWGLHRRSMILDAAAGGGSPTPQEKEFLDVTSLWLRAQASVK